MAPPPPLEEALQTAGQWLRHADALVVVSEPRMGIPSCPAVSSSAPDAAVWAPLQPLGVSSAKLPDPSLFKQEPRRAWGFWLAHCRSHFEPLPEHYGLIQAWAAQTTHGGFVLDAGVEGCWARLGLAPGRIMEVHGSLRWLQCSDADCKEPPWDMPERLGLEEDPETHCALGELPTCRRCGSVARPCTRLSQDDQGFCDLRLERQRQNYFDYLGFISSGCDPRASNICLYLAGDAAEASPGIVDNAQALVGWGFKLIRVGPKEDRSFSSDFLALRLDLREALQRLHTIVASNDVASVVFTDSWGKGVEVVAPVDMHVHRLLWKAYAEVDWDLQPANEHEYCIVENIVASARGDERQAMLDPNQPVPQMWFTPARGDIPVSKVRLSGVRFGRCNSRFDDRVRAVRNLLTDLVAAFSSEEYQAELARAGDQIDIRLLVKEVHLTLLPRHGFEVSRDMDSAKLLKMQTRMQSFINAALSYPTNDPSLWPDEWPNEDLNKMASGSLLVSGVAKMASLPARRKGRPKAQAMSPLVLKAFSQVVEAPPGSTFFHDSDSRLPLVYGGWLGDRRAPTAFLEAPCEELAAYLRDDPDGPFMPPRSRAQEHCILTPEDLEHWRQWDFEVDQHEAIMKADWHTLPDLTEKAELFIPRLGKPGSVARAPPRCVAFAEAFRLANVRCWSAMVQALQELQQQREITHDHIWTVRGSRLVGALIRCLSERGMFGVMESQVWWGDRSLTLPSHKDGATSLLHLGVTLGGRRTLRVGAYRFANAGWGDANGDGNGGKGREDVWDDDLWMDLRSRGGTRKDVSMELGSMYISSPYCFEHGVRFEMGSRENPIISLQCRLALEPSQGKEMNRLRDHVMWDISNTIASVLRRMTDSGGLRLPTLQEVQLAEGDLGVT